MAFTSTSTSTSTDQAAAMESVLVATAGSVTPLRVSDSDPVVSTGGTWSAEFGAISGAGDYTAPGFTPPFGLDTITYVDPYGNQVVLQVRIQPNPSILGSDSTPFVQSAYTVDTPDPSMPQPGDTSTPYDYSKDLPATQSQAPTVVVGPDQSGPAPAVATDYNSTPQIAYSDTGAGYPVQATLNGSGTTTALYVPQQAGVAAPTVAKVVPGAVTGTCTNGTLTANWTGYSTTYSPTGGQVLLATVKVDAGIQAQVLKVFGINLSVGATYNCYGQYYKWKRSRRKDVYKCVNGTWVYQYSKTCISWTQSLVTTPVWYIIYTGYPRNNQPLQPWGPEACS